MDRVNVESLPKQRPAGLILIVFHVDLEGKHWHTFLSAELLQIIVVWAHPWECCLLLLLSPVLTVLRLPLIAAHDLDEVGFAFAEERGLEFEVLVLQSL